MVSSIVCLLSVAMITMFSFVRVGVSKLMVRPLRNLFFFTLLGLTNTPTSFLLIMNCSGIGKFNKKKKNTANRILLCHQLGQEILEGNLIRLGNETSREICCWITKFPSICLFIRCMIFSLNIFGKSICCSIGGFA